MVKTELSYNPYLNETEIKFNGQLPKINSLVEKYEKGKLYKWIDKIPEIFRDEMNGYDFELEYSGVEADFEKVKKAFRVAGVDEEQVKFFYKNELESPDIKSNRIDDLVKWLEENPNRKFEYSAFRENNRELLEEPYRYILLHGNGIDTSVLSDKKFVVESVDDINELDNTILDNTAIVFYIDDKSPYRESLQYILERKDIKSYQLFFYIHSMLNVEQVERVIVDFGVNMPQLVTSINDDKIMEYYDMYPIADYIRNTIMALNDEINSISCILDKENKESIIVNSEIHKQIDNIEEEIKRLKGSYETFNQRDNIDIPCGFVEAETTFKNSITNWRKRKTKVTKEDDAILLSRELDRELMKRFAEFFDEMDNELVFRKRSISEQFDIWYKEAEIDINYVGEFDNGILVNDYDLPKLADTFMKLKEEKYVTPKEDLIGKIFANDDNNKVQKPILETIFYCEIWRNKALEIYNEIIVSVKKNMFNNLKEYYDKLAYVYQKHLEELIENKTAEKENIIVQLSDDEKMLQIDNDWLTNLKEKVAVIERG